MLDPCIDFTYRSCVSGLKPSQLHPAQQQLSDGRTDPDNGRFRTSEVEQ